MLNENPDIVLVNIRTPDEVRAMGGTINAPHNLNIPCGWLEFRLPKQVSDPEQAIVVYCGGNVRSPLGARTLQEMGYKNVFNYARWISGLEKAGSAG